MCTVIGQFKLRILVFSQTGKNSIRSLQYVPRTQLVRGIITYSIVSGGVQI